MDAGDNTRKASGCGLLVLYNSVFRRRDSCPRRQSSVSAGQSPNLSLSNVKRRRSASDLTNILTSAANAKELTGVSRAAHSGYHRRGASVVVPNSQYKYAAAAAGKQQQEPYNSTVTATRTDGHSPAWGRTNSITTELDNMIHDHQRSKGSSALLRASSGNVMVFGNLCNIRAPGAVTSNRGNAMDHLPKTAKELNAGKFDGSYHKSNRNSNNDGGAVEVETRRRCAGRCLGDWILRNSRRWATRSTRTGGSQKPSRSTIAPS